jgi:hypothetical protein
MFKIIKAYHSAAALPQEQSSAGYYCNLLVFLLQTSTKMNRPTNTINRLAVHSVPIFVERHSDTQNEYHR